MEHHYLSSTHKHLMWLMNSKNIHKLSSSSSSSAAAAAVFFQEPVIGGFAWPPRSYSCSFCRREFRSAQALGGHMNVHRRDRARLKHHSSSSPPPQILLHADETAGKFHHHHRKHSYSYKLPDDQDSMEKFGSSVGKDLVDGRTVICNKRHKTSSGGVSPILPLFIHGNKLVSSSAEIDLELRLGDPILHL